jgi:hypothetical protein
MPVRPDRIKGSHGKITEEASACPEAASSSSILLWIRHDPDHHRAHRTPCARDRRATLIVAVTSYVLGSAMFKKIHPVVGTRDIQRARGFYTRQLGFEFAFSDATDPPNYVGIST